MESLLQPAFVVDFLAVGLGVLLGHQLSERRERSLQADQEDAERERLQDSLERELEEIRGNLRDWEGELPPNIGFPTGSYESGISSGRFALLGEDLQQDLNRVYDTVERLRARQQALRERSIANDSGTAQAQGSFDSARAELETEIDKVLADL